MARTQLRLLLLRRHKPYSFLCQNPEPRLSSPLLKPYSSTSSAAAAADDPPPKPNSLSARMSFVFDQIDAIERERSEKNDTLQKIRAWRESKLTQQNQNPRRVEHHPVSETTTERYSSEPEVAVVSSRDEELDSGDFSTELGKSERKSKKEVVLVHPWPEWIELIERLVQQNYFDHKRSNEEEQMVESLRVDGFGGMNDSGGDLAVDFAKDFRTVQNAFVNFGKDRFDILRSLSRKDLQLLVGYGCPSADRRVVMSGKLLRKRVHLDEGDVCSSCSLRSSCEKAFLVTNKEDEARTIDVMRVLLAYGFDPTSDLVTNKPLLKDKSLKAVVRKLLHEIVKLSAVPIDPNLPPPVIKRPPPKVKQPPPPPKKRVGRDDIEMKKGDWLCPKCDFMNFAKNTICLQCDAKRPKRQLLPGEWECPQCNFLNYRRNMVCFHCDCKRPHDEFIENKMEERTRDHRTRFERSSSTRPEVSNAWNFDFDDDESDGADVAAFETADSAAKEYDVSPPMAGRNFRDREMDDVNPGGRTGTGFDDFEDEEDDIDSYEVDSQPRSPHQDRQVYESEDADFSDVDLPNTRSRPPSRPNRGKKPKPSFSGDDELGFDSDEELSSHSKWKSSHVASGHRGSSRGKGSSKRLSFGSDDDDDELDVDSDSDEEFNRRKTNTRGGGRSSGRRDDFEPSSNRKAGGRRDSWDDNRFDRSSNRKVGGRRDSWGDNNDFDRSSKRNGGGRRDSWSDDDDEFDRSSKRKSGGRRDSWNDDSDRSSNHRSSSSLRGSGGRGGKGNGNGGWRKTGGGGGGGGRSGDFDRPPRGGGGGARRGGGGMRNSNPSSRSRDYGMDHGGEDGEFRNRRRVITR